MEQRAKTPQCQLKQEPKDIQVPQGMQPESSYLDPTVEDAIANINAPQHIGELTWIGDYRRHHDAATRHHHVTFENTSSPTTYHQPAAPGTSETSGPTIQVPQTA